MKKKNVQTTKKEINDKHIKFYDKTLSILEFILDEYSKELTRADVEFLDMPKNSVATLDFLIFPLLLQSFPYHLLPFHH